ncbi:DUF2115 family protein [Methanobrevibacter sp.]|uniref:DUF2115 family protein n=1 Tax=Methanobrevibacter sp. TaxID=66852 RepID=UPI003863F09C
MLDFYKVEVVQFDNYAGGDIETREFTKYISLYLALIGKKPLHPFGDHPSKDDVFLENGEYKCRGRIVYIKDEKSLCRYCVCKNAGYSFGFH